MLGVQRPTMTIALGEFDRAGLIAGGRRQVTILGSRRPRRGGLRVLPPTARTTWTRCPGARHGLNGAIIYMTDRFRESSYPIINVPCRITGKATGAQSEICGAP